MTFKKDYWKKRNKAREETEKKNKRATSEQEKQASNQQASMVSRTVDHGPGTTDPQA